MVLVLLAGLTGSATAVPAAAATRAMVAVGDPDPNKAAIQQVIQRSNDEQVQAVATRNLSVLADTLTDDHYAELASTIQDMLNNKVTGIELLNLDWGPITVAADGSTATATTFETWRITSRVGSVVDAPERNDYALVLDSNTSSWKIRSDVQALVPELPTGGGGAVLGQ